jgi:hypothetical protein
MKKTLLIASLFAGVSAVNAQTVITVNDAASEGAVIYTGLDTTSFLNLTPGNTGSGQSWDYSSLLNQDQDTIEFMSEPNGPEPGVFPNANLVFGTTTNGTTAYSYVNKSNSMLEVVGQVVPDPIGGSGNIIVPMQSSMIIAKFPTQLGNSYSNYYRFQAQIDGSALGAGVDSIRLTQSGTRYVTADAEGSLTTPKGVFNALRTLTRSEDTTVIEGQTFGFWQEFQTNYDTVWTYDWWANKEGFPLVTMRWDSVNQLVGNITWIVSSNLVGINNNSLSVAANAYPNPANNELQLPMINKEALVKVSDIGGREIFSGKLSKGQSLNVSALANGSYLMNVYVENELTHTEKVIIAH